jgi:addiction module HigA family antidote
MRTPIHPGEILKEGMDDLNLSANQLALRLKVPTNRITQIIRGQRSITPDTARRLSVFFETSIMYWINLQTLYDIDKDFADKQKEEEISSIEPYAKDASNF